VVTVLEVVFAFNEIVALLVEPSNMVNRYPDSFETSDHETEKDFATEGVAVAVKDPGVVSANLGIEL
jgi:hypothetical protein